MTNFWILEAIKVSLLFSSAFFLGSLVLRHNIRVNYTRKIFHFILFFSPIFLASKLPFESNVFTVLTSGSVLLFSLLVLVKPIRDRSVFISTAFAAIDRPEDRPFTMLWVSTQLVATYAVLMFVLWWLGTYDRVALIYITVLVAGIGDGLAEPVGIRFGKHFYKTKALFTDRVYTRSLEGSACVFVSAIIACVLLRHEMSSLEFTLAVILIPTTMTLAEAISPHTWDGPLLYLIGGGITVLTIDMAVLIG